MHTQTKQRLTSMPSRRRLISLLRFSCSDWSAGTWLKKLPSPFAFTFYYILRVLAKLKANKQKLQKIQIPISHGDMNFPD